ncbi:CDGSH iron-sulfur domain-containing protein 3 mitochondrial [Babesia microti strain RI]|uniref:CDGSH iron-sulfur domain-containing protein 3 mitochondrial n=1 Tax=Babesia microti (strain RI) TaxID=1133968 RepID=A0A0K3AR89_BABMR|nr:CDGSH iron-sulfur domain-containing protein 3 mitochondrial [Babesia microti strain RI]CTQ40965.1 CDGSH iron-sulfur domain-containing protein 3 mitochondrial [Babesia microti strain RI]|eukprot:XP_012648976.1 CDGSH iron-sulfur domain-containing protein 3 mitochondrial [Babesia microti strain RI]
MPWFDWWPHDPVPSSSLTDPLVVKVKRDQVYWWCSCGLSKAQPWCDGSHKGTAFKPVMYAAQHDGTRVMCGCKFSKARPICDGSHMWVKAHKSLPKAALATFGFFFSFGVFTSWILHP